MFFKFLHLTTITAAMHQLDKLLCNFVPLAKISCIESFCPTLYQLCIDNWLLEKNMTMYLVVVESPEPTIQCYSYIRICLAL